MGTKYSQKNEDRFKPPPLIVVNNMEVDLQGNPISNPKPVIATTLINKRYQKKSANTAPPPPLETDPSLNPFYDPRVNTPKVNRPKRSIHFVEQGTYIKKAQHLRKKAQIAAWTANSNENKDSDMSEAAGENPNLIALGVKEDLLKPQEPIPDVEWWDAAILVDKYDYSSGVREEHITLYVEHPAPIKPPADAPTPPPQALKMTKKELKKLRKLNRMEAQRERQERILLGLEKPPEAKVKLSNLMRVLGQEAVQDPTQVEKEVRKQMAQRLKNHQLRNEARKLTPQERKAKKKRKLLEDTGLETKVAVYRINDLTDPRKSYKVDINARENHLSGCMLLCPTMNLVIVEGGPKALRRFKKLMLRRIDWNAVAPSDRNETQDPLPLPLPLTDQPLSQENSEASSGTPPPVALPPPPPPPPQPTPDPLPPSSSSDKIEEKKDNKCLVVWEGTVLKHFKNFRFEQCPTEPVARKYLRDHAVESYWDMAKNMKDELLAPTSQQLP
eukprot:TRINITY_DN1266_c1_g4_i1.p2 TRINITY_DN1266_c1_g4~~TRINITY_DN1266_c1_g4_i1.p2  ORF type:complete len:500 (+),score=157.29 TRINITY_DN1266_c1_g4_i1:2581-4080(+)